MIIPDLRVEQELWLGGRPRVAGVDEVGRGPLAGPVVAAACILPVGHIPIDGVRDSKTLSPKQREKLFGLVLRCCTAVGIGAASVREIEEQNVLAASHLAMRRAVLRLGPFDHVLVDGLPIRSWSLGPYTPVIDGDAHIYSIACASIVAKVVRDRLMAGLAKRYPGYGWERNFGYSTSEHVEALHRLGPTPLHRRLFEPVRSLCMPGLFSE